MSRAPLIAVTGRFQPFHADHLALVQVALLRAEHVIVGITNPVLDRVQAHHASAHRHRADANPWSYEERRELVTAALACAGAPPERYSVVPFPLDEPERWPALVPAGTPQLVRVFGDWEREKVRRFETHGYPALVLEGDAGSRISATDIRAAIRLGRPWQHWVPPGTRELLAKWLAAETAASRLAPGAHIR